MRFGFALAILLLLACSSLVGQQTSPAGPPQTTQPCAPGETTIGAQRCVTPPRVIHNVDPAYPEQARQAKLEGSVVLGIVVGVDGKAHNIRVVRPFGSGLDEQAVAAVQQWEFQPATKDGKPVAVNINIEVNFRLYHGPTPPIGQFDAQSEALRIAFESLAERVVKGDFDGAYKFLSEQTAKNVSANRFASSYKMLEAENGELQSIKFAASWTNSNVQNAPIKTGVVVARHQYESKQLMFTYLFRQERQEDKQEWKLLAFRPGNQLPTGAVH